MGVSEKTGKHLSWYQAQPIPSARLGFPGAPSHLQLFATPWTVASQAPLSMGFSRHIYWSGLPFPPPRNLSNPGIKPKTPSLQAESLPLCLLRRPVHGVIKSPTTEQAPTQARGACYNVVATHSGKQTHSEGQCR